jgi:hypothetical protein
MRLEGDAGQDGRDKDRREYRLSKLTVHILSPWRSPNLRSRNPVTRVAALCSRTTESGKRAREL